MKGKIIKIFVKSSSPTSSGLTGVAEIAPVQERASPRPGVLVIEHVSWHALAAVAGGPQLRGIVDHKIIFQVITTFRIKDKNNEL